jgi:DNA-directed RNA polymerase subunit M/transcription elongation factor TFIIS
MGMKWNLIIYENQRKMKKEIKQMKVEVIATTTIRDFKHQLIAAKGTVGKTWKWDAKRIEGVGVAVDVGVWFAENKVRRFVSSYDVDVINHSDLEVCKKCKKHKAYYFGPRQEGITGEWISEYKCIDCGHEFID